MIVAHLLDMDGVLVRAGQPIAGSADYIAGLVAKGDALIGTSKGAHVWTLRSISGTNVARLE